MKFLKSTEGIGWLVLATLAIILLFVWDSYHSKTFYGLLEPAVVATPATVTK